MSATVLVRVPDGTLVPVQTYGARRVMRLARDHIAVLGRVGSLTADEARELAALLREAADDLAEVGE